MAVAAFAFGGGVGWLAKSNGVKSERRARAIAKAEKIQSAVKAVDDARAKVAMKLDDINKTMVTDPDAGITALDALIKENEQALTLPTDMFGWELASMGNSSVKNFFSLYHGASNIDLDLKLMRSFAAANKANLGKTGGPSIFAILAGPKGGTLVELVGAQCGEPNPETKQRAACPQGKEAEATAYVVRMDRGGESKSVEAAQITPLIPGGAVYAYAIGNEPAQHASNLYNGYSSRIKGNLEALIKENEQTNAVLEKYISAPTIDASSSQE